MTRSAGTEGGWQSALDPEFGFTIADLFAADPSSVIVSDLSLRILWVTDNYCDLFRLAQRPDEIVGRSGSELARLLADSVVGPERFLESSRAIVARAVTCRDRLEMVDGRHLERVYWPVRRDGEAVAHVWRFSDVTEEHLRDEAFILSTAVLEELVWAHGTVVRDRAGAELFGALLDGFIRVTGSAYGFIGEVDDDEYGLPFLTSWATTNIAWSDETGAVYDHAIETDGFMQFRNLDTLFGVTLRTGQPVFSNDPPNDPRSGGLPEGHPPLVSYVGLPIHRDGRLIGMVGLAGRVDGYDAELVSGVQPLLAASGSLLDAFVIERERQAAEERVREALLAAERANAAKSQLLGRVSHELRTPLSAVLGFAELLAHGETDAVRAQWLALIHSAGHHVLAEVNDLIDLSAAEAGRLTVDITTVALDTLVADVVSMMDPVSAQARVRVRSLVAPGTVVLADATRLRTVLVNLVSNAIKFNDEGGGSVDVSAEVEGVADAERLSIVVADDGPGITDGEIDDAFVMFERLGADHRKVPGTGLGLTIAREYARAMGGDLVGRRRAPRGLEVVVTLPMPPSMRTPGASR
ncbi:MAG: ATP-binding protein [Ilumatobacteraceae bacterium]